MTRAFVAVYPDDAARRAVSDFLAGAAAREARSVRWTKPEQVHFTLRFFGDLDDEGVRGLAGILIRTLTAVRHACGDPDYNLVMYSAPTNGGHAEEVFHWHLKLIPRLSTQAGFEIGSGMAINTVAPEDAAQALRDALERARPAAAT